MTFFDRAAFEQAAGGSVTVTDFHGILSPGEGYRQFPPVNRTVNLAGLTFNDSLISVVSADSYPRFTQARPPSLIPTSSWWWAIR